MGCTAPVKFVQFIQSFKENNYLLTYLHFVVTSGSCLFNDKSKGGLVGEDTVRCSIIERETNIVNLLSLGDFF